VFSPPSNLLDDRGQPTTLFGPAAFEHWPVQTDPRIAALMSRVDAFQRRRHRIATAIPTVCFGSLFLAGIFLAQLVAPAVPPWLVGAAIGLALCPFFPCIYSISARRSAPAIADLILAEGLCPACGYNFVGLSPSDDRCIECPECGSAWNAARVARAYPFITGAPDTTPVRAANALLGELLGEGLLSDDDRGNPARLVAPRLRLPLKAASGEMRERLRAARHAYSRGGAWIRWPIALLLLLLMLVGLAVAVILAVAPLGRTSVVSVLLGALVSFALAAGVLFGNFGYRAATIVRCMKSEQLCPSCATDLHSLPPEADGCRICPLCLAAWRFDP
jgi:hypothetical protein